MMFSFITLLLGNFRSLRSMSLNRLLVVFVLLALCACGSQKNTKSRPSEGGYTLTVPITSSARKEVLAKRYGGEAIIWRPESGFAVFRLGNKAKIAFESGPSVLRKQAKLERTSFVTVPFATKAWAGGFSAWAGGWSAWAGGWSAWAGGSVGTSTSAPVQNLRSWNQIRLYPAHAISRRFGSGVIVAVIDTGIDLEHPAFKGRLAPGYDFVDNDRNPSEVNGGPCYGHGTGVAGLVMQVAPKATILPIRVLGNDCQGDTDRIAQAIDWAVRQGANVINLSLGSRKRSEVMYLAASNANKEGVLIFSAVGNTGDSKKPGDHNDYGTLTYPSRFAWESATFKRTVGIGSIDREGNQSNFSAFGSGESPIANDDVYGRAPGESLATAYPSNQVAMVTGTSFATPLFSGAAALALGDMLSPVRRDVIVETLWDTLQNTRGPSPRILNIASFLRATPGWTRPEYQIVNAENGRCLEIERSSLEAGAYVVHSPCGTLSTQWFLGYVSGSYAIANTYSKRVLDVENSSTENGAFIRQRSFKEELDRQRWSLRPAGGSYEIVAKHSNKCLGTTGKKSGHRLNQWDCTGSPSQQWKLKLIN
jgi:thermitase